MRPGVVYVLVGVLAVAAAAAAAVAFVAAFDPARSLTGTVGAGVMACLFGTFVILSLDRLVHTDPDATVYQLDSHHIPRNVLPVIEPLVIAAICVLSAIGTVLLYLALGDSATLRDDIQTAVVVVLAVATTIAMPISSWRSARSNAHLRLTPDGMRWIATDGKAHSLSMEELVAADCVVFRSGKLHIQPAATAVEPYPRLMQIQLAYYGPNLESVLVELEEYVAAAGGAIQRVNRFR
ncbi:hypothetical protein GIY30_07990 [Gordonia sp. HNM0687]|uniref:Uncharacterized protein n=1 Tax=Gordonia mangrovi TaxID=2665643 RepID=A0A6L7GNV9_9ACTN|nr:hypothetical protein [Gordonia mangrovi]MXP21292.1 hypothetical protein [Gordonia mangrovi]UVF80044.1 hypothetical protein NWF22_09565 [Gordonia mangrovi]